jgi:hypothetical protein
LSGLILAGIGNTPIVSADTSGSISGVVSNSGTGVAAVCVTATGSSSGSIISTTTGAGGTYTLGGLSPDNYTVFFDPSCSGTVSSPYAWQYYSDVAAVTSATAVSVASGAAVANINATLVAGSTIAGAVTGTGGSGLGGVCVEFYLMSDSAYVGMAVTAGSGSYQRGSFPEGEFMVRFDPTCGTSQSSPYASQDYNGQSDFSTATPIDFTSPASMATGINAALVPGASISGTVSVPGATSPANVCVEALGGPGYLESFATTNSTGAFDITSLPADTYRLRVDPTCLTTQTTDYGVNFYNNDESFSLSAGGSITGITAAVALDVAAVAIVTPSLPVGVTASPYSATVQAGGGTGSYTWTASGLPNGLSINATTGAISGTPSVSGTFTVTVTASDTAAQPVSATGSYSLLVSQPAVATTTTTTTTTVPRTEQVCSDKTKTETIRTVEVKNGKKVVVVSHKKVRVYKTVTVRKVEKIKGKKVVVISHKIEVVKVCKTVVVS